MLPLGSLHDLGPERVRIPLKDGLDRLFPDRILELPKAKQERERVRQMCVWKSVDFELDRCVWKSVGVSAEKRASLLQQLVQLQFGLQYTPDAKHSQYLPRQHRTLRQQQIHNQIHNKKKHHPPTREL